MSLITNTLRRLSNTTTNNNKVVTYHLSQSPDGTLSVAPNHSSYQAYAIQLSRQKGLHNSIDVALRIPDDTSSHLIGHCLVQVSKGRFLHCQLGDNTDVTLEKQEGKTFQAQYALNIPGHNELKWVHNLEEKGEGKKPDRELELVESGTGDTIALFTGTEADASDFGVLDIYQDRTTLDSNWCGLLVLTAVCVFAREEWNRGKHKKVHNVTGFVGNWGGLLSTGIPLAGA